MRNVQKSTHTIDFLFVITLFFLFAISSLAMIAVGARVYRNSVDNMSENAESRTAYLYLVEKLHQNDIAGGIELVDTSVLGIAEDAAGATSESAMLRLSTVVNEETYYTYLYLYKGYLCEMQVKSGYETSVSPATGQRIIALSSFDVTYASNDLLSFHLVREDGVDENFSIYLHGE